MGGSDGTVCNACGSYLDKGFIALEGGDEFGELFIGGVGGEGESSEGFGFFLGKGLEDGCEVGEFESYPILLPAEVGKIWDGGIGGSDFK